MESLQAEKPNVVARVVDQPHRRVRAADSELRRVAKIATGRARDRILS